VLFQESTTGAAQIAYPDGRIEPFAPIPNADTNTLVNWVTTTDGKHVAWTVTQVQDSGLISDLFSASADGSDKKLVLHTSSSDGIETLPLAMSDDAATIYYSRQPHDLPPYQLFPVTADVYSVDTATGKPTQLPRTGDCLCAAGVASNGRRIARLEPNDAGGFNVHLWDLSLKTDTVIPAPATDNKQAGFPLISRDGNMVVYTSAHGTPPAKGVPPEQYAIIIADAARHLQQILVAPIKSKLRPVAFKSDNSVIVLVGTDSDGTYKLTLKDGNLQNVSAYTFVGRITG
jgi:hypothetical protein